MKAREQAKVAPEFRVDVFDLARYGGETAGAIELARLPRLAGSVRHAGGLAHYTLHGAVDALQRPAATLHLTSEVELTCDRCDGPVRHRLDTVRHFFFVHSATELEAVPIDEGEEEALLGSEQFDLAELIEDELILSLPLAPRHDRCARDGQDTPQEEQKETERRTAAIAEEDGDGSAGNGDRPAPRRRPFAVLAQLKSGKSGKKS